MAESVHAIRVKIIWGDSGAVRRTREFKAEISGLDKALGSLKTKFISVGLALLSYRAITGITRIVRDFGKMMISTASDIEQSAKGLRIFFDTTEEAAGAMERMLKLAAKTPFDIPQMIQAGKLLRAFRQDTDKWLRRVGDIAFAVERDLNETAISMGKVLQGSQQSMRLLGTMGISQADLLAAGWKGSWKDIQNVQESVFKATQRFHGSMATGVDTLKGKYVNLKDQIIIIALILGKPIRDRLSEIVGKLFENLQKLAFETPKRLYRIGQQIAIWAEFIIIVFYRIGKAIADFITNFINNGKILVESVGPTGAFGIFAVALVAIYNKSLLPMLKSVGKLLLGFALIEDAMRGVAEAVAEVRVRRLGGETTFGSIFGTMFTEPDLNKIEDIIRNKIKIKEAGGVVTESLEDLSKGLEDIELLRTSRTLSNVRDLFSGILEIPTFIETMGEKLKELRAKYPEQDITIADILKDFMAGVAGAAPFSIEDISNAQMRVEQITESLSQLGLELVLVRVQFQKNIITVPEYREKLEKLLDQLKLFRDEVKEFPENVVGNLNFQIAKSIQALEILLADPKARFRKFADSVIETLREIDQQVSEFTYNLGKNLFEAFTTGFEDFISAVTVQMQSFKDAWNTFWKSVVDSVIRQLARLLALKILGFVLKILNPLSVVGGVQSNWLEKAFKLSSSVPSPTSGFTPTVSSLPTPVQIVFNAPVYGMDDFEIKIDQATKKLSRLRV